jgi:hypothetical protein
MVKHLRSKCEVLSSHPRRRGGEGRGGVGGKRGGGGRWRKDPSLVCIYV